METINNFMKESIEKLKQNLSQTIVVFYLRKRYLFYGYFFVEALGKEFFYFLNFVLRNLGNILHQKYRFS